MAQIAAIAGRALASGGGAAGAAGSAGSAASQATSAFQSLGQAMATVNPILAQITPQIPDVFGKLKAGISEISSQVVSFVSKLNPAFVNKWNLAVDDLYATIGRALIPVLQQATSVVRSIGDAFASLDADGQDFVSLLLTGGGAFATFGAAIEKFLPPMVSIFNSLGKAANAVMGALEPVATLLIDIGANALSSFANALEQLAPLVELVGSGMKVMGQIFESLYRGGYALVRSVLQPIDDWLGSADTGIRTVIEQVTIYLKAFGQVIEEYVLGPLRDMTGAETKLPGSSVGAAMRTTSIGDQQSFINKALTSAFAGGMGVKTEEQKRDDMRKKVLEAAEQIKKWIEESRDKIVVAMDAIQEFYNRGKAAGKAAEIVTDAIPGRTILRGLTGF